MRCAWKQLLSLLPLRMRSEVDRLGQEELLELRLRLGEPVQMVLKGHSRLLPISASREDLNYVVNAASRYSPWNCGTVAQGFLTAPGGHRIGLCGEAVTKQSAMDGLRQVTSLCIRVARDIPGIAGNLAQREDSTLILGAPGWGKTTLLRDLIRQLSDRGHAVAVVDERGELFPAGTGFPRGCCTDVLTGCGKPQGIETLLRTMGPEYIAVDEITARPDAAALLSAAGCGVKLLATAHAGSVADFLSRESYQALARSRIFQSVAVLRQDKTYKLERMAL